MSDGVTITTIAEPAPTAKSYSQDAVGPIAGLLGLDTHNIGEGDSDAIQDIYRFVRGDAKEMTDLELLHSVRQLELRLGMTGLGERRVDKLHRYVKLQSQIDRLSQQRDRELR
jgi:hypothetical protein